MVVPITNPKAIFPDLPRNQPMVGKDGKMDNLWILFFENLVMALQTNLKPEGFVIPIQTAANIALLTAIVSQHNIVYDSTNNLFDGNIFNIAANAQFWIPFAMMSTFAGNPNGFVAGFVSQLCLDTATNVLYVCTTAGNAAGAVWTAT
jgi:hypothetical protein